MNHTTEFSLSYPQHEAGAKIRILRGEISLLVAQDFLTYRVDDVLGKQKATNPVDGSDIKMNIVSHAGDFRVEIQCTRGGMSGTQWSALLNTLGDMTLQDASGNALTLVRSPMMHTLLDTDAAGNFTADVLFTNKHVSASTQSSIQVGDPSRFCWTLPSSFKFVRVPVTFRDLPMP
jgi:hypothetical protein